MPSHIRSYGPTYEYYPFFLYYKIMTIAGPERASQQIAKKVIEIRVYSRATSDAYAYFEC